jgi:4-amino-4-deoxy-L-arabinose transferase-like glycosyltransferase
MISQDSLQNRDHTMTQAPYLWQRLPDVWSGLLFRAQPTPETAWRWLSLWILLAVPGLMLYPTRSFRLLEPDEGRYAEIAREMVEAGTWVVPTLQGEPYLDKPPLFYWLVKIAFLLLGVSDASARLVPALCVHATILAIYFLGRRSLGERAAFAGACTLMLLPGYMAMGRLLILDGLLTLTVTLELLFLYEAVRTGRPKYAWWYAAAFISGLGILTKGPIALLLVFPPLLAYRWLNRNAPIFSFRHVLGYGLVLLAVNAPWYLAIYAHQPVFLRYFFWEHNILRFVRPFDHLEPVWYYLPITLLALAPCLVFARSFLRWLAAMDNSARTPAVGFFLLSGGWCLAFFSVSGSKLPTYILPAFPPLALVFGAFLVSTQLFQNQRYRIAAGAWAATLFFVFSVAFPYYAQERSPLRDEVTIARLCADPTLPVVTFPRHCDSVSFYLQRTHIQSLRSRQVNDLLKKVLEEPRTVVLLTHDHTFGLLAPILPADLVIEERLSFRKPKAEQNWLQRLAGLGTPWGLCDIAVIRHRRGWNLPDLDVAQAGEGVEVDLGDGKDGENDEDGYQRPHPKAR